MANTKAETIPTFPAVGNHTVRDIVIGMSDGLTVPFALAAGLTGVVTSSHIVATAGVAEIIAGSISMGLGGYLAARSDQEHYMNAHRQEEREVLVVPESEAHEVQEILVGYGLSREEAEPVITVMRKNPKAWVDFMMHNELGLETPVPKRAFTSAATIAISYIIGGIIPMMPYFLLGNAHAALFPSITVTLIALALFGLFKGRANGVNLLISALQTMLIGGIAAGAAYYLAGAFTH